MESHNMWVQFYDMVTRFSDTTGSSSSSEADSFTSGESNTIYGFFIGCFCTYLSTFIFTIFIILKYIVPMKMEYPQIWGFYLLAITIYLICVVEMGYYLGAGAEKYKVEHDELGRGALSGFIVSQLNKCVFMLITLTMYHLYLGLAFVNQRFKKMSDVYRRQNIAFWIFSILSLLVILTIIPAFIDNLWNI